MFYDSTGKTIGKMGLLIVDVDWSLNYFYLYWAVIDWWIANWKFVNKNLWNTDKLDTN